MAMKWSEEQKKAIYDSGKTILVNAGAGSGKTAVLTERLLQKVNSGVHLSQLIVLTFTRLAAKEMKERLRAKLMAAHTQEAQEELAYIDQAHIETFDAYTSGLVKKYHYLLNIPKDFQIVDAVHFKMISMQLLNEIFNHLYQTQSSDFFDLLNRYTTKDDQKVLAEILKVYHQMRLYPNYEYTLSHYDIYFSDSYIEKTIQDYLAFIKENICTLGLMLQQMDSYTADAKLNQHYNTIVELYTMLQQATSLVDYNVMKQMQLPKMPAKVEDAIEKEAYKKAYDVFKEKWNQILDILIYESEEEIQRNYTQTMPSLKAIIYILQTLDQKLKTYKREHNAYDFNDIAFMAISLLQNHSDIASQIRSNTVEILIDEYQDTSDIQDQLIQLIQKDNVYMVGDVKQSIYRFRYANPELFKSQYARLKASGVIDLSKNFRSRKEVLDGVNLIFKELMSIPIGGVDYDISHILNYGFTLYDQYCAEDYQMKILTYEEYNQTEDIFYTKAEQEAFIIGKHIIENVQKKYVYDKEENRYRPSVYSDYAILTSDKDKFDLYKKIFEYLGIPLDIYKDETFTKSDELYVCNHLFKTIEAMRHSQYDSFQLKKALTGLLRSFLFEIGDDIISEIVTSSNIVEAFKQCLPDIYQSLDQIAHQLDTLTLTELLTMTYQQFRIYEKMLKLYDVEASEARINYMFDIVQNLEGLGYKMVDMIDYFDLIVKEESTFEVKMTKPIRQNTNTVKMMSIHASKGLEFPICFFPELYKKFNLSQTKDMFMYSKEYQLIIPYSDTKVIKPNICKALENNHYITEEISEKIRLLYVALTRPREQMIFVCPMLEPSKSCQITDVEKKTCRSFYDMLNRIYPVVQPYITPVDWSKVPLSKEYLFPLQAKQWVTDDHTVLHFQDVGLEKQPIMQQRASKSMMHIPSSEELALLEQGNIFHQALEVSGLSLEKLQTLHLPKRYETYITRFLNHPFIQEKQILHHYHEYAFEKVEQDTIIKGVIDLILETPDAFYIIDYKLSQIEDISYQKQLHTYYMYLSGIVNKPVYTYLYSIYRGTFLEVESVATKKGL
ncbi:MAG: UvrD-helicase domain-containing protein [Prevotella sp.]|nr:UvrD-helicase domain-containing protein [Staphylococcus sp.]MCM1351051.1 UvrD-helicase domain-containing protein [Prevotella sp.]